MCFRGGVRLVLNNSAKAITSDYSHPLVGALIYVMAQSALSQGGALSLPKNLLPLYYTPLLDPCVCFFNLFVELDQLFITIIIIVVVCCGCVFLPATI